MLYGNKLDSDFIKEVKAISGRLSIRPDWLTFLMGFETGGTFDPAATNKTTGATGLIQFMPDTAAGLGTTTAALRNMTAVQQLPYVEKYLQNQIQQYGQPKNVSDLYLLIFYPASVNWNDTDVYPDSVYRVNKGLDFNKNGALTKGDVKNFISDRYAAAATELGNIFTGTTAGDEVTDKKIIVRKTTILVLFAALLLISSTTIILLTKKKK